MMMSRAVNILLLSAMILIMPPSSPAEPLDPVPADSRCPVCGMFVAKFDVWITEIRREDGKVHCFDGVKDLMAYYFDPVAFDGRELPENVEVWVKDYYSLKWLDARKAFFVVGSDVLGPMGHELVPFATRAAAEAFMGDHQGNQLLAFEEIGPELIDSLRVGNKMRSR